MSACDICGQPANYSAKTGHAVCSLKCEMEVIGLTDLARNRRLRALLVEALDALRRCQMKPWLPGQQGWEAEVARKETLARLDAEGLDHG